MKFSNNFSCNTCLCLPLLLKRIIPCILFFAFVLLMHSCELKNGCGECFTPPNFFDFELVDSVSGENLFTNGTYKSTDIKVIDLADSTEIKYNFINEDTINILEINTIGWHTEIADYAINIAGKPIFNLYVDASRINDECCSYTRYNEISINGKPSEFLAYTGIYKIFIQP